MILNMNENSFQYRMTQMFFLVLMTSLFMVFYFSASRPIFSTLLISNLLIITPVIYFVFIDQSKIKTLLAPLFFNRALLVQASMQILILLYWGYYNPDVYLRFPLIIHQLAFTYLFHFLCCMFLERKYVLNLSLIPLTLSINLFLWFAPAIYFGHFIILALAVLAKIFIVRDIEGRKRHIFNPSAIVLSLVIVLLILFPSLNQLVYGPQIGVSWLGTPHMDTMLFALSFITLWTPNGYLISIGAIGFIISADFLTDTFAHMPLIAELSRGSVLLGTTFLITDPSTSPKGKIGQLLFGISYGASIAVAFTAFSYFGLNTYYDKLFFVCVLNYLSPMYDQFGESLKRKFILIKNFYFLKNRLVLCGLYLLFIWSIYPRFERKTLPPFFMSWSYLAHNGISVR